MELKEIIKNARRKLETQWLPLCLARRARRVSMVRPVAILMISNQDLRVSWKPVNPQECVWKNLNQNIMRTILQEEETIHHNITIWYTNLFLCLKQWRYPQQKQQKQQWNKDGRKLKRFRHGTKHKSETNLKWLVKQEKKVEKYTSHHWWTSVIWRMPNWRQSTPKKTSSCIPRRHCERWFWILCSIHRTSIISITNDGRKGHGYHIQTARLRRTSSWRSIC